MFARISRSSIQSLGIAFVALAASSTIANAGNVYVVSPSGPYTQIQPAIDAASDYDTILVKPFPTTSSTYDGFVLNGKSLAIVGDPTPGHPVKVFGEMNVQATPANGLTVIASFETQAPIGFDHPMALDTLSNAGAIRVESCQLFGSSWTRTASIVLDADTQLISTNVTGKSGTWSDSTNQAGYGLLSANSTLRLFGCNLTGGNGGTDPFPDPDVGFIYGGDGGDALEVSTGFLFASDCAFQGGNGGNGSLAFCPEGGGGNGGNGGDGIELGHSGFGDSADVFTLTCTMNGGSGGGGFLGACPGVNGQPGMPVRTLPHGAWQNFANGHTRYLSGTPLARENASVPLIAKGVAGDRVYVRIETVSSTRSFPFAGNHSPLGHAQKPRWVFLGTIPTSGSLSTTIPAAPLGASTQGALWRLRSTFVLSSGAVAEGNDFVVAIVDSAL